MSLQFFSFLFQLVSETVETHNFRNRRVRLRIDEYEIHSLSPCLFKSFVFGKHTYIFSLLVDDPKFGCGDLVIYFKLVGKYMPELLVAFFACGRHARNPLENTILRTQMSIMPWAIRYWRFGFLFFVV